MKIRLAAPLQSDSIVDGPGIRSVIWTQGCPHNCPGCQNPMTHDFKGGYLEDIEELKEEIKSLEYQDGITFSGGDPMWQPEACNILADYAKKIGLNVWCYTGYTFEQLLCLAKQKPAILEFLHNIDILVDGKFIMAEKSLDIKFRGSRNQRIIDVKKSLKTGEVEIAKQYLETPMSYGIFGMKKEECVFI